MRTLTMLFGIILIVVSLNQTIEMIVVNGTDGYNENNQKISNYSKETPDANLLTPDAVRFTNGTPVTVDDENNSNASKSLTWTTSSTFSQNLSTNNENLIISNESVLATKSSSSKNKSYVDAGAGSRTNGTPAIDVTGISSPNSGVDTRINSTAMTALSNNSTRVTNNEINPNSKGSETIIYSWTFFCHGITSPIEPYPNDRYSPSYWEFQLDWLTNTGQKQMYELGKWIRDRYSKFCEDYHPRTLEILTESSDCTFMSAECLLAGLFPFNGSLTQNKTTSLFETTPSWQPIPVHTVQSVMDSLGSTESLACRQYDIELDDVIDKAPWSTIPENYFPLIKRISDQCGYNFVDISLIQLLRTVYNIYYDLKTEELAGLRLPKWTKNVYPEPMQTLAAKYLELFTFTDTLQRFKAGPTIGNIVNSMQQKTGGNLQENLKLYSGSQCSLTSIMNAFGVFNHQVPPFASAFLIELSKSKDQFFVTMFFKNSSLTSPYKLIIPDCGYRCRFERFHILMQNKIPVNWSEECDIIPIAALTLSTPLLLAGLVVIIVLIFLALLLLVKCCRCFNKKKSRISNY